MHMHGNPADLSASVLPLGVGSGAFWPGARPPRRFVCAADRAAPQRLTYCIRMALPECSDINVLAAVCRICAVTVESMAKPLMVAKGSVLSMAYALPLPTLAPRL